MLPHIGGKKFDVERFLKTGVCQTYIAGASLPDTPAMRQAKADIEREREDHRRAGRG
jgi:hypothetical protein